MIVLKQDNTAITAPQLSNVTSTLAAFRVFKDMEWLTVANLHTFMSKPTPERQQFIASLNETLQMVRTDYATKTYE